MHAVRLVVVRLRTQCCSMIVESGRTLPTIPLHYDLTTLGGSCQTPLGMYGTATVIQV